MLKGEQVVVCDQVREDFFLNFYIVIVFKLFFSDLFLDMAASVVQG